MQCELLTGKVTRQWVRDLPGDDWRKTRSPYFQEPYLSAALDLMDAFRDLAKSAGFTPAQFAVAWVLRQAAVTSAIVGARKPGQISDIFPAAEAVLPEAAVEEAETAYQEFLSRLESGASC